MQYLDDHLKKKIAKQALRAPHVFFLLDYDGTLTPIMSRPEQAILRDSTRKVLKSLCKNPNFSVAIISGRALDELKALVKLSQFVYVGNHGLELSSPNLAYSHAKAKEFRRVLREVKKKLEALQKLFPGSFLEDKKLTLTYHYRLLESKWTETLKKEFTKKLSPWLRDKKIQVTEAKKALEVRPNFYWNKGSAVRWILLHEDPETLPVYIGDDQTDEHAFQALNERGITIRVGYSSDSSARYFVEDTDEVLKLLSFLTVFCGSKK